MAEEAAQAEEEELPASTPAAQASPQNGHVQQPVKASPYDEVITRRRVFPANQASMYADPLMANINRRPAYKETEKTKSDRAFLEDLQSRPEACDYILVPHRVLPRAKKDGTPLKSGKLLRPGGEVSSFELMPYDSLVDEMIKAWAGGQYRIVVYDRSGRTVPDMQVIILQIPSDIYPPKAEEYEENEAVVVKDRNGTAANDENSERRQRLKEMREQDALDEAESKSELAAMARRLRHMQTTREMSKLTKQLSSGGDDEDQRFAALEKRLEQEKRDRDAQLEKIEQRHKEDLARIEGEKKELQRKNEDQQKDFERRLQEEQRRTQDEQRRVTEALTKKPDDTIEKIMAVMAPIAVAIIQRPPPALPPPPPVVDHTPMMIEMQRSNATIVSAMLNRPKDDSSEKVFDAVVKLTNKDNSSRDAMIGGLMQAFVTKDRTNGVGPEMMKELIEMGANLAGGGQAQVDHGDDYNPALGFLGNTGKSLFKALQSLIESAATNPQVLELVKAVVGTRKPTQEQILQAAYRYEQSGQLPPGVGNRMLAGPQFTPQFVPQPAAPAFAPQPQPARPTPPPQPQPSVQGGDEIDELEGAASGLPGNGDPADTQLTPEQMAEQHLNQTVTETIQQMIEEVAAKPAKRSWPEYGTEHINKDFLQRLVDQPSDNMRMQMISAHCHPTAWGQLRQALHGNLPEQNLLVTELHRMIDMAKEMLSRTAAPTPPPVAAPTPQPEPVAPPTQTA